MYIKLSNSQYPISENQIKEAFPDVSFKQPFTPPVDYAWVFPTPKPEYDTIIQRVIEITPTLSTKNEWEQQWSVVSAFTEYTDDQSVVHTVSEQETVAIANHLAKTKELKILEISNIRNSKIYNDSISYTFPGDTEPDGIQMRNELDRQNIQDVCSMATMLIMSGTPDKTLNFMPYSNIVKTLTATQVQDMCIFLKTRGDNIMTHSWSLKTQIRNATIISEINLIDLETRWPE